MDFDGHTVDDTVHGIEAVISHHVEPVIGWMRLSESEGRAFNLGRFSLAFSQAADVIEREMREKIAQEVVDYGPGMFQVETLAQVIREGGDGN